MRHLRPREQQRDELRATLVRARTRRTRLAIACFTVSHLPFKIRIRPT